MPRKKKTWNLRIPQTQTPPADAIKDYLDVLSEQYDLCFWVSKSLPWNFFYDTLWTEVEYNGKKFKNCIRKATPGSMTPEAMDVMAPYLVKWAQDKRENKVI